MHLKFKLAKTEQAFKENGCVHVRRLVMYLEIWELFIMMRNTRMPTTDVTVSLPAEAFAGTQSHAKRACVLINHIIITRRNSHLHAPKEKSQLVGTANLFVSKERATVARAPCVRAQFRLDESERTVLLKHI